MYSDNVILCDVDGVLLNWVAGFHQWYCSRLGISSPPCQGNTLAEMYGIEPEHAVNFEKDVVKTFNDRIEHFGYLGPKLDAVKYVKKLYEEHGMLFHAITCSGTGNKSKSSRIFNLDRIFGEHVFKNITFLEYGELKTHHYKKFASARLIIDDDPRQIAEAAKFSDKCILFGNNHSNFSMNGVAHCRNWKEIYEKEFLK